MTTLELVLRTFAVAVSLMVTGLGPQEKVMTPPAATAFTTACDVQLAGVPSPMTRVGREVSAARAAAGTGTRPPGLPGPDGPCGVPARAEPAYGAGPVYGGAVAAVDWPVHADAETVIPDTTETRSVLRRNRMSRG
ncbi:hypothetical protein Pve01_54720 [Planomonospora venezuelensis]|nr:hypothetical protein Pve01_54720 [Planomonospora venezuelensis]